MSIDGRKAITTVYKPATEKHPARIFAKSRPRSLYIRWNSDLTEKENHKAACQALAARNGWLAPHDKRCCRHWFSGTLPDDRTWVHVIADL